MTPETLTILFVGLFVGGIALFVVGIAMCKQDSRNQENPGFSIDPKLYRSGRHLPVSRGGEGEFINRAH